MIAFVRQNKRFVRRMLALISGLLSTAAVFSHLVPPFVAALLAFGSGAMLHVITALDETKDGAP